jgi:hypothetical protein
MTLLPPRAFLKKHGFDFEKTANQLDRAFIKSFSVDEREAVELAWFNMHSGFGNFSALYSLPKTEKQAGILFSYDRERYVASLEWARRLVSELNPSSITEIGCGAGYLLRYLKDAFPDIQLHGVEIQRNLLALAGNSGVISTYLGNYFELDLGVQSDLVICDFGWDNHDIPASKKIHSVETVGALSYCPWCSDDAVPFFQKLLAACISPLTEDGTIALTGRLRNVGDLRAFMAAAQLVGLNVVKEGFRVRKVLNQDKQIELFPTFIMSRVSPNQMSFEDVAEIYQQAVMMKR